MNLHILCDKIQVFLLDGTGNSDYDSLVKKVKLQKQHGRKVVANYVTVKTETALERNVARAQKGERGLVPPEYVAKVHKSVSQVVPRALEEGLFDEFNLYDTNVHGEARLVASAAGKAVKIHDKKLWGDFIAKGTETIDPALLTKGLELNFEERFAVEELTAAQMRRIIIEETTNAERTVFGDAADAFRKSLEKTIAAAEKNGWIIDVPFEWPDP